MRSAFVLTLTVLCLADSSFAQTCGGCLSSCSAGECCLWDNPPINMDPDSLGKPNSSPLGFTTAFLPNIDTDDPPPCVTVIIPEPSNQTYIQVAVDSPTSVCVFEDGEEDDERFCDTVVFYCNPDGYKDVNRVTFRFECPTCTASTALYFRVELEEIGRDDEFWCQNTDRTLPLDLIQNTNTAFTVPDIDQPDVVTESASSLVITPALLVISLLIAMLSL